MDETSSLPQLWKLLPSRPTIHRWYPNKVAVATGRFLELTAPKILFDPKGPMWHGFVEPARMASLEYYW
jgi:hypothetical protein